MRKSRIPIVTAIVVYLFWSTLSSAQQDSDPAKQYWRRLDFMGNKRLYSQLVMEGFMTEQKEVILYYGTKMLDGSGDDVWAEVFKTQSKSLGFKEKAKEFREEIALMLDGMRKKNPDAAMAAYSRSLQRCYECHAYARADHYSRLRE